MKVAVIQSNYIPWRGYFDIMHDADVFVFYDDVQYTVNDWRNRNRVKTANGVVWLTIPVGAQNDRLICDVVIGDQSWARKHWMTIEQSYHGAPGFARYREFFKSFYSRSWESLSALNQFMIRTIAGDLLGIRTQILDSRDYNLEGKGSDRLLMLLKKMGATDYISGPSAQRPVPFSGQATSNGSTRRRSPDKPTPRGSPNGTTCAEKRAVAWRTPFTSP